MSIEVKIVVDHYAQNATRKVFTMNGIFLCDEGSERVADLFASLAVNGAKFVKDWAGPGKRVANCTALLRYSGYACELRFDAAHGRRYLLAAYPVGNPDKRRCALAALHGMRNTNPEIS